MMAGLFPPACRERAPWHVYVTGRFVAPRYDAAMPEPTTPTSEQILAFENGPLEGCKMKCVLPIGRVTFVTEYEKPNAQLPELAKDVVPGSVYTYVCTGTRQGESFKLDGQGQKKEEVAVELRLMYLDQWTPPRKATQTDLNGRRDDGE